MSTEAQEQTEENIQLTKEQLDELAYYDAVMQAGILATKEAEKSQDNYGGELLHRSIAFGD